jgi:Flp pilus assembly protein TadD
LENQIPEARKELEEALRLKPDFPMAHLNLGVALMKLDQFDAAEREFQETLRLDRGNKLAADFLVQLHAVKNQRR